jgi:hypothetical protein
MLNIDIAFWFCGITKIVCNNSVEIDYPVGCFNLESRFNYTTAALSPNGLTLLAVNEDGEIHLISLVSRTVLHRYRYCIVAKLWV